MRYVFIVNPTAGVKNIFEDVSKKINNYFKNSDTEYKICKSEFKGDITYICRCEAETGDDIRVYCFGGDGTMFEAVNGLAGFANVELGVFPSGSGNDFIRTFGNRKDFLDLDAQIKGESIEVDLIKTNNGIAINNACLGFDAKIGYEMAKFKKMPLVSGSRAYELSLAKACTSRIGENFKIKIDTPDGEELFEDKFLFVVASNGKYYGGGFNAAPNAVINDGLIDFVLVKKPALVKIPALVNIYKKGEHIDSPKFKKYLTYLKGYSMEISSEKDVYCTLDGEGEKVRQEFISLNKDKLKFILPISARGVSLFCTERS